MSPYLKIRLAMLGVGLLIALFARLAGFVSGNHDQPGSSSPGFSFPFGGGSNPEAGAMKTPESAASSLMQAMHAKVWRRVYYLCAFEYNEAKSDSEAAQFQTELDRAAMINHNPLAIINLMASASEFHTGNSSVRGSQADVPTFWTIPYDGETLKLNGTARMILQNGAWHLDLTAAGTSAMDNVLGTVTSRTGHGPQIIIPHFGPFMPHNFPTAPMAASPSYSPGGSNNNRDPYQPANPIYHQPPYMPPTHYLPPPHFAPPPRFGPDTMPRGPRFGPTGMPGGFNGSGGGYNSAGGGYNNSGSGNSNAYGGQNGNFGNPANPLPEPPGDSSQSNGPTPPYGGNGTNSGQ